jgi:glycosyltransferase involved in cell wall biosynthesis
MSNPKLGTVYLGKKGGAESHLLIAKQLLVSKVDLKIVISSQNQKISEYESLGAEILVLDLSINRKGIIDFFRKKTLIKLIGFFSGCRSVYFYLPHPFDNFIARALLRENFWVIRSIHDHMRHPGDTWPTKASLSRQIRFSSEIVTHSQFVAGRIEKRAKTSVKPLPAPLRQTNNMNGDKVVLFVGRFKAYKGIKHLLLAWPKVINDFPDAKLILAGDGKIKLSQNLKNITVINKWLSSGDIEKLIDASSCVVFPYRQASQSGPLSLAISAHKPVVITNVGGLKEQAVKGTHFEVELTAESISCGIIKALQTDIQFGSETIENRELADYLIENPRFRRKL